MKKILNNKMILIVIGVLLGIICLTIILIIVLNKGKNENIYDNGFSNNESVSDEDKNLENVSNKSIYFYNEKNQYNYTFEINNISDHILSSYTCNENSCNIIIEKNSTGNYVIADDKVILYDAKKGIISEYPAQPIGELCKYSNKPENMYVDCNMLYIKKENNYGIIDLNGKVIHEFNLNKTINSGVNNRIPNFKNNRAYSVEDDMIIDIKNDKYGISRITKNEMIVDYLFDSLIIINEKYYKGMLDNKWYLYSFETNEKIINTGYDDLFVIGNIVVTKESNYLYIKDITGKKLIEDSIYISPDNNISNIWYHEELKDNKNVYNYNIIDLYIQCNEPNCDSAFTVYQYNITNNKLNKI